MQLNKRQVIVVFSMIILFLILWLGFDTKPKDIQALEKSRALSIESTGIQNLISDANKKLTSEQLLLLNALGDELSKAENDSIKYLANQKLSSKWYELGYASVSGYYAEQSATIKNDENSWSIAGTTYVLCLKNSADEKVKDFCFKRAVKSFENAVSINPENVSNRINLALCYIENPPQDKPMSGVLMLRELNSKYPDNVAVLNQLGRLALKTNQINKAIERLEHAVEIEPDNITTICLLAEAYSASNQVEKSEKYQAKCLKK